MPRELFTHPDLTAVLAELANATDCRDGRDYWGCCPFHGERTPSFHVSDGTYYCFGCHAGGGALDLVMRLNACDKGEAMRWLSDRLRFQYRKSYPQARGAEQAPVDPERNRRRDECLGYLQRGINLTHDQRARSIAFGTVRDILAEVGMSHLQWTRFLDDCGAADELTLKSTSLRRVTYERTPQVAVCVPDDIRHALEAAQAYFVSQPHWPALLAERGFTREQGEAFGVGFAPRRDGLIDHLMDAGVPWAAIHRAGLLGRGAEDGALRARFYDRLMLPLHDAVGNLIGFAGRLASSEDRVKYLNSPTAEWFKRRTQFYGLQKAWSAICREKAVVLVEGYFDVMRLHTNGETNVIAINGAVLTDEQADEIRRWDAVVTVALDSDSAGKEGAKESCRKLLRRGVWPRVVVLGGAKDPDEWGRANPSLRLADQPSQGLLTWVSREEWVGDDGWLSECPDPVVEWALGHRFGVAKKGHLGRFRLIEGA